MFFKIYHFRIIYVKSLLWNYYFFIFVVWPLMHYFPSCLFNNASNFPHASSFWQKLQDNFVSRAKSCLVILLLLLLVSASNLCLCGEAAWASCLLKIKTSWLVTNPSDVAALFRTAVWSKMIITELVTL